MLNENAYRDTYATVNPLQCVFERAILCRCCGCEQTVRRNIAEREAAGCKDKEAHALCEAVRKQLRQTAAFTLKLTHPDAPIPHAKELKLQCGGLKGIELLAGGAPEIPVNNIHAVITAAIAHYGSLEQLPFADIIQSIRAYEPRRRRR